MGQQHRKLQMLQLTVKVNASSRSKLRHENARSLQLSQLYLHIRGGVVMQKVNSSQNFQMLRMRIHINETQKTSVKFVEWLRIIHSVASTQRFHLIADQVLGVFWCAFSFVPHSFARVALFVWYDTGVFFFFQSIAQSV